MFWRKQNSMKLADLLEDFILHTEVNTLSARTSYNYRWRLRWFLAEYGEIPPKTLRKIDLQRFRKKVDDSGRYTESSVDAIAQGVQAFVRWLFNEEYIDADISRGMPRKSIKERPNAGPISKEATQTAFSHIETKRERALMMFLLDTGARRGEIASVKVRLIDFDDNIVWVNGKTGLRPITFIDPTKEAMLDYYHNERPDVSHGYFFCNVLSPYGPMGHNSIYRLVKRLGGSDAFTHPHAYRHLVANEYAHGEGGSLDLAKEKLGHKHIATTMYYVHTDLDYLKSKDGGLSALNLLE